MYVTFLLLCMCVNHRDKRFQEICIVEKRIRYVEKKQVVHPETDQKFVGNSF